MPLTELQRQQIVTRCKIASAPQLWTYLSKEDTPAQREALLERMKAGGLQPEKVTFLEERLHQPNPQEQEEWKAIEANSKAMGTAQLEQKLKEYLTRWEPVNPYHNHIDDARHMLSSIVEITDWQNLDRKSYKDILSYLAKYPHSAHFQELDDILWSMVDFLNEDSLSKFIQDVPQSVHRQEAQNAMDDAEWNAIDQHRIGDVETFRITHPQSRHAKEAQEIITSYAKWDEVNSSNDIFVVNQYIKDYPSSHFKQDANNLLLSLRQDEIREMHRLVNQYDTSRFMDLINKGIFNIQSIINEGLITEESYDKFCNNQVLPEIIMDEKKSIKDCPPDRTDVFFFGIPSTGKTCILMGLLNSKQLSYDPVALGGSYGADLVEFVEAGRVPPSTYGTFTTAIKADVKERNTKGTLNGIHHLNLIEMSGEEFAFQIVKNPDGKTSFEQMGSGATNILRNKNRKAIFIILDPTADKRKIKRPIFGVDQNGNKFQRGEEVIYVSQKQMLERLFGLFRQPENKDIAELIDSFHFIVTKADLLGDEIERRDKARDIILARHGNIIPDIKDWCREYGINNRSNNEPKLFPFSLGHFYIGDVYDYDDSDANRLIDAIINYTIKVDANDSIWSKVTRLFNKPII